jgi:hypothetical protein
MSFRSCSTLFCSIALALVFVGGTEAQTEVYSNIVGYQRVNVRSNGLALVSTPFVAPTNASVQEVVGPQLTGGASYATGDRILLWNQQSSEFIRLFQISHLDPAFDGKWVDTSVAPPILATNEILTGSGFWMENVHTSNQTVVLIGDIVTDDAVTNTVYPGLQLLSNPYSSEVPLNSSGLTNGHPGISFASADRLSMWDPDQQQFKRFFLLEHTDPAYHRKWIDTSVVPPVVATNDLATGEGFWYERNFTNDFQWVEVRPYSLP